MARIKNNSSGIVHAEGTYIFLAECGASPYSFKSLPDSEKVTCKTCLRILKEREKEDKKRICRLPSCEYYSTLATTYCCNACSADAYDDERLSKEEQEMEKKRKNLANQIKRCIDEGHFQSIMLEPKALKILQIT